MGELFKLSDVDIDTVGLVDYGANNELFLILKAQHDVEGDDKMSAEEALAMMEQAAKNMPEKVRAMITEMVGKVRAMMGEDMDSEMKPMKKMEGKMSDQVVEEKVTAPPADTTTTTTTTVAPTTVAEVTKTEPAKNEQSIALEKANDELRQRLEKAENEIRQEREKRERGEYLEKARGYSRVPAKLDELADQLYFLAKADAKRLEWWEALLKAMNEATTQAAIFVEKGTSNVPVQPSLTVKMNEAIKAGKSPKDALDSLSKSEQEVYLAELHERIGTK